MKINFISDVHLEFGDLEGLPGGDVLVLAGDILVAKNLYWNLSPGDQFEHQRNMQVMRYFKFAEREFPKYKHVVAIAGNHEYYNGEITACETALRKFYGDFGAHFLQGGNFVDIEEHRFIGATLWTNFNNRDWFAMQAARQGMNDFAIIEIFMDPRVTAFLPMDAANLFDVHRKAIFENLGDKTNVVITHHLPTYQCVNKRFAGDKLTPSFASELGDDILNANIQYWIHGHTHDTVNTMVGNTNIRCNPRGYHGHETNPAFNIGEIL